MEDLNKVYIYALCMVCYCSSHDDFIGIFSSRELAYEEAIKRNDKVIAEFGDTFDDGGPYYVRDFDVSKYLGYVPDEDKLLDVYPKWTAIYQVPSVGEFILVPSGCTAIEEYEIDKVEENV